MLNDDEPYIVRGDDGSLYKVEWHGGSSLFWEGDEVTLTDGSGWGSMIDDDNVARVWVEEISPEYPRIRVRPVPTPIPSLPRESMPPERSTPSLKKFVEDFVTSGNYDDPEKEAVFKFQFTVGNLQKTIRGSGENVVLIGNATTNPKVISVKSKILNQQVERSGR